MPALTPDQQRALKEISQLFDKASTYNKVIIGLGYGGFFAAWSATKQHLSPKALVLSALFITISLVFYVGFVVYEGMVGSSLLNEYADALDKAEPDIPVALEERSRRLRKRLRLTWRIVFPATVITGSAGACILIGSFVQSLIQMWTTGAGQ